LTRHVKTRVHFRELSVDLIETYIRTGSPFDKAGAYGIQDYSGIFVDHIDGCFYNVVGFPLSDFYATLQQLLSEHQLRLVS
jgi:septum formation protein